MALTDYHGNMIDALTTNAVNAHIAGDMKAFVDLELPIAKNLVQAEAMVYGQEYRALLRAEGASIIKGKKIPWLAEQAASTRDEVYSIIETGLKEGKPVASIGGKRAVPGTIAHDLKETLIYDADYKYVRAARSEHARIQNQGALTRFEKNNIVEVEVVDGMDFDEACAMANGQIWKLEYARRNETEHPNCTRTFGPVIPKDWMPPEEEPTVKLEPKAKIEPFKIIKTEAASKKMSAYVKKRNVANPEDWGNVLEEVQFYTEFGFEDINKILRLEVKRPDYSASYDDSINALSKFLKDAPKSRGIVYRGMRFDEAEDFNKFITSIKKSDTTVMKSFTSTSTDIDNIQDFLYQDKYSVVMNIKSTNGVFIDDISATQGELEVLFNHHTKFKINKVTQVSNNRYNIDLEELIT